MLTIVTGSSGGSVTVTSVSYHHAGTGDSRSSDRKDREARGALSTRYTLLSGTERRILIVSSEIKNADRGVVVEHPEELVGIVGVECRTEGIAK